AGGRRGAPPKRRARRGRVLRVRWGSPPPLLVFWPRAGSPTLACTSGCLLCCFRFGHGDAGGEISSETPGACTFPSRFHQGPRVTLEQGHLAIHRREDKRHRFGPTQ